MQKAIAFAAGAGAWFVLLAAGWGCGVDESAQSGMRSGAAEDGARPSGDAPALRPDLQRPLLPGEPVAGASPVAGTGELPGGSALAPGGAPGTGSGGSAGAAGGAQPNPPLSPDVPITYVPDTRIDMELEPADSRRSPCGWLGTDEIEHLVVTPDGARVITIGSAGLRVYDAATGAPLRAMAMGERIWDGLSLSADGTLVTAGHLGQVWRVDDGALVFSLEKAGEPQAGPSALSPDGRLLATEEQAPGVINLALWDLALGTRALFPFPEGTAPFTGLAFSPDGQYLLLGHEQGVSIAHIWSMASQQVVSEVPWPEQSGERFFRLPAFSPEGTLVVAQGAGVFRFPAMDLVFGSVTPSTLALMPDGARVVIGQEESLSVCDASGTFPPAPCIQQPMPPGSSRAVAVSPLDGSLIAGGSFALSRRMSPTASPVWSVSGKTGTVLARGAGFVSLNPEGELRRWTAQGELLGIQTTVIQYGGGSPAPFVLAFGMSPDGTRLVTSAAGNVFVGGVSDSSGSMWSEGSNSPGIILPFARDGLSFLDSRIYNWSGATEHSALTGELLHDYDRRQLGGGTALYSRDESLVIMGGVALDVIRRDDGVVARRLLPDAYPAGHPYSLALHPTSPTLATCDELGVLRLWDDESWTLRLGVRAHPGAGQCHVAYSPDGEQLLSLASDALRVWRASDLELLDTLAAPGIWADDDARVTGIARTEDGRNIAAMGTGGGTYLYCLP